MRIRTLAGVLLGLGLALGPVSAADDAGILRLALCQDSWMDWHKTAPAAFKAFADRFRADFARNGNDPFFVPRKATSIAGLRIVQAFPESVGMGVGFSVTVDANFAAVRKILEAKLGKPLTKCETGDGMQTCELDIAEQRTVTLMTADNDKNRTLVGCYYFYEK